MRLRFMGTVEKAYRDLGTFHPGDPPREIEDETAKALLYWGEPFVEEAGPVSPEKESGTDGNG